MHCVIPEIIHTQPTEEISAVWRRRGEEEEEGGKGGKRREEKCVSDNNKCIRMLMSI